jgi:2-oxo-3-hexenedioate decarboxylase
MELTEIASLLDQAALDAKPVPQVSKETDFTVDDAYEIQRLSMASRYSRGENRIGIKMGFTSEAKMKQMGVHDLIWGRLTDAMMIENKGVLKLDKYIHPRAEPEVCFRLSKDLDREILPEEAWTFVDAVAPAIEIIDSRYRNFKFSLEDVVADNCSSAGLVLGEWTESKPNLNGIDIALYFGDEIMAEGSSDDILGNPWMSLVHASRLCLKYNEPLKKGDIVMAGAATPACYLKANTSVKAEISGMDLVEFQVE